MKARAYGSANDEDTRTAHATLAIAVDTLLRLFAPFLPFVTEEVWSWWKSGSIHQAKWPESEPIRELADGVDPAVFDLTAEALSEIRRAKTEAKRSLKTVAEKVTIRDTAERLTLLKSVIADLSAAGNIN